MIMEMACMRKSAQAISASEKHAERHTISRNVSSRDADVIAGQIKELIWLVVDR